MLSRLVHASAGDSRGNVRVEPKLMNWQKNNIHFGKNGNVDGWTVRETWQIEVQIAF